MWQLRAWLGVAVTVSGLAEEQEHAPPAPPPPPPPPPSQDPEQQKRAPPNLILVVTDQERFATVYDGEDVAAYRKNSFSGDRLLCESRPCMRFTRHYTAATASTPARGSLYTGLHARVHQALQSAFMKQADDDEMQWLDASIATMGDYLQAAGYDTAYFGDWHLSSEEAQESRDTSLLEKFGFASWERPDIPSPLRSESGQSTDDLVVDQATQWLEGRARQNISAPFLLVVNLNSPGQIQHWPTLYKHFNEGRAGLHGGLFGQVPIPDLPPTLREDLLAKSATSKQAPRLVDSVLQLLPPFMQRWRGHLQAYLLFQKDADDHLSQLMRTVQLTFPSSMVVRTSDRGEMGGAHGGLRGNWYNAYEESIRVPLIISGPLAAARSGTIDEISSSVDIIPTMLAMAQADLQSVQKEVFLTHRQDQLPGRNLLIPIHEKEQIAYFETYDHLTRHQQNIVPTVLGLGDWIRKIPWPLFRNLILSEELDAVTNIEAVVAKPGGDSRAGYPGRGGKVWKLVRFWDDPEKWAQPGIVHQPRLGQQHGRFWRVSKRTQVRKDELELYDLDRDPMEQHNLAYDIEYHAVMVSMQSILNATRPSAVPAIESPKVLTKARSVGRVGGVTGIVAAALYIIKRVEREFPYGTLKILAGLLIGFRLIGPYKLTKRLLARLAMPINLLSGVVHPMIGLALIHNHLSVFPPYLPLLPDALAHESSQVYTVLGVLTFLCGAARLAYVMSGTSRGANAPTVCMTWVAEWAVLVLLLRSIPTFDVLDCLAAFVLPLVAVAATLCLGDVPRISWRVFFIRQFGALILLTLLSWCWLVYFLKQQGLIRHHAELLDDSRVTALLDNLQVGDSGGRRALLVSLKHMEGLTESLRPIVSELIERLEPIISQASSFWK